MKSKPLFHIMPVTALYDKEAFFMLQQILKVETIIFYILAAEMLVLILLQFRTNGLLKRTYKMRAQKKENVRQLKEEVKGGTSDIPVVKFEKQKRGAEGQKKPEKKSGYDTNEVAVLQEMMSEFFG